MWRETGSMVWLGKWNKGWKQKVKRYEKRIQQYRLNSLSEKNQKRVYQNWTGKKSGKNLDRMSKKTKGSVQTYGHRRNTKKLKCGKRGEWRASAGGLGNNRGLLEVSRRNFVTGKRLAQMGFKAFGLKTWQLYAGEFWDKWMKYWVVTFKYWPGWQNEERHYTRRTQVKAMRLEISVE